MEKTIVSIIALAVCLLASEPGQANAAAKAAGRLVTADPCERALTALLERLHPSFGKNQAVSAYDEWIRAAEQVLKAEGPTIWRQCRETTPSAPTSGVPIKAIVACLSTPQLIATAVSAIFSYTQGHYKHCLLYTSPSPRDRG